MREHREAGYQNHAVWVMYHYPLVLTVPKHNIQYSPNYQYLSTNHDHHSRTCESIIILGWKCCDLCTNWSLLPLLITPTTTSTLTPMGCKSQTLKHRGVYGRDSHNTTGSVAASNGGQAGAPERRHTQSSGPRKWWTHRSD